MMKIVSMGLSADVSAFVALVSEDYLRLPCVCEEHKRGAVFLTTAPFWDNNNEKIRHSSVKIRENGEKSLFPSCLSFRIPKKFSIFAPLEEESNVH
jgi:hypothetical protein